MIRVFAIVMIPAVLLVLVVLAMFHARRSESVAREEWLHLCATHDFAPRQCALLYRMRRGG